MILLKKLDFVNNSSCTDTLFLLELLKLDLEKSPMLKLACILKFHQVVIDALNSQGIKDNTSADVLVPTLIYTIVR